MIDAKINSHASNDAGELGRKHLFPTNMTSAL